MRGLFIKLHGGFGPKAQESARQSLKVGMDIARTAECAGHEPLDTILARTPSTFAYKSFRPNRRKPTWKEISRLTFQAEHGLSPEDVAAGYDEFLMATKGILLPREQQAVWLELCRQRKHGRIPNWKDALLVSDCGSSLGFSSNCPWHVSLRKAREQVPNIETWCA